jgi:hypothetical protein
VLDLLFLVLGRGHGVADELSDSLTKSVVVTVGEVLLEVGEVDLYLSEVGEDVVVDSCAHVVLIEDLGELLQISNFDLAV